MSIKAETKIILVVDDDPVNRLLSCQTLIADGFTTIEADCGEAALTTFIDQHCDLILLDVMMPGIDGFETCKRLRATPDGYNVPILIMTGLDDEESIRRAYESGVTDFITKPITWPLLGHRVRYMLRASDAMLSLARNQASLANAQHIAKLGSWHHDLTNNVIHSSEEIYRILELNPKENTSTYEVFRSAIHPEDRKQVDDLYRNALQKGNPFQMEHRLIMPDSRVKWVKLLGVFENDGYGRRSHCITTIQDITERKLAEEQVQYLAYYDSLTGLPNRNLFQEYLARVMASARRYSRQLAILMLNLNRFRRINDIYGHNIGDQLLKQVGELIQTHVRSSDCTARMNRKDIEVIRWSGDEFAIVLTDIESPTNAGFVAQRLLEVMNRPYNLDGEEITMTACMGIALFPEDGNSVEELVKNAQAALWHARKAGPNTFQFYTQAMNALSHYRLSMENDLRRALETDQFELFYQPIVDAGSGEIIHAEALLRWHHPEKGLMAPGTFISLAEECGLIIPIGEWVLNTACRQICSWQEAGLQAVPIAVNIAATHLQKKTLVAHVKEALAKTGLSGQWLELEVTESMLMENIEHSLTVIEQIRMLGVHFAIDDFGTGYSSLNYLRRLPVRSLKIDRSFICNLPDKTEDLAIVRTIVALGHSLNLIVVAEGIEEPEQASILAREGVDLFQGYLFSRPVPPVDFTNLLSHGIQPG